MNSLNVHVEDLRGGQERSNHPARDKLSPQIYGILRIMQSIEANAHDCIIAKCLLDLCGWRNMTILQVQSGSQTWRRGSNAPWSLSKEKAFSEQELRVEKADKTGNSIALSHPSSLTTQVICSYSSNAARHLFSALYSLPR